MGVNPAVFMVLLIAVLILTGYGQAIGNSCP